MSTFDDRQKGFEGKLAQEEKLGFAVEARLSKLYGHWAAEQMGVTDAGEKDAYGQKVIAANLEEPGFDDILRFVRKSFDEKGVEISDHVMQVELDKCLAEAKKQIAAER